MTQATLSSFYRSSAFDPPEYPQSVREILENEDRFLEETLDYMERLDTRGMIIGWDMGDLISQATVVDCDYRRIAKEDRHCRAVLRLIGIIGKKITAAANEGDFDEVERLSTALADLIRSES